MLDGPSLSGTDVPSWVAGLMFLLGSLGQAAITIWRHSRGEKSADFRRLEMEVRLGNKIESVIQAHEDHDDETFVRIDLYNADQKHARALGAILEKIEGLHEKRDSPRR